MGGFARYPWPQYINNAPFYYNKHYKYAVVLSIISGAFNYMWVHRYLNMSILGLEALLTLTASTRPRRSDSFDTSIQSLIIICKWNDQGNRCFLEGSGHRWRNGGFCLDGFEMKVGCQGYKQLDGAQSNQTVMPQNAFSDVVGSFVLILRDILSISHQNSCNLPVFQPYYYANNETVVVFYRVNHLNSPVFVPTHLSFTQSTCLLLYKNDYSPHAKHYHLENPLKPSQNVLKQVSTYKSLQQVTSYWHFIV